VNLHLIILSAYALASIFAGVCGMLIIHLATGGRA